MGWTFYNSSGQRLSTDATSGLQSTIVSGSRTASAGAGAQAITGAGFTPTAVIILGATSGSALEYASVGIGDDEANEESLSRNNASWICTTGNIVHMDNNASNGMNAVLTSLDADGCTLTWTVAGSGVDTNFRILFLR
jgi:hypothetical protein